MSLKRAFRNMRRRAEEPEVRALCVPPFCPFTEQAAADALEVRAPVDSNVLSGNPKGES